MNRVVVTGYGMITPLGHTAASTWDALISGQSGIGPITLFDASSFGVQIAGQLDLPARVAEHRPFADSTIVYRMSLRPRAMGRTRSEVR